MQNSFCTVVGGKMIFDTKQYKTGDMLLRPLSFDSMALQPYSLNLCRCETKDSISLFEEVTVVLILQNSANDVLLNKVNRLNESVRACPISNHITNFKKQRFLIFDVSIFPTVICMETHGGQDLHFIHGKKGN